MKQMFPYPYKENPPQHTARIYLGFTALTVLFAAGCASPVDVPRHHHEAPQQIAPAAQHTAAPDQSPAQRPSDAQDLITQRPQGHAEDRKSTRLNSSHVAISYAVFCMKQK